MAKERAVKPRRGSFAEKMTTARMNAGWTLEEMALWLKVPRPTLQKWELGQREPDAFKAEAVLARVRELKG